MNYLAHLYFSADPEMLAGNLMGDFVKGRLDDVDFPPGVLRGLRLHRRIDTFAETNVHYRESRNRIAPPFRLCRGVLVDLFYDHFLALRWSEYSPLPYPDYLRQSLNLLLPFERLFPPRLQQGIRPLFEEWLPDYPEVAGVERTLERIAGKMSRPVPLQEGVAELVRHYSELEEDFRSFMIDLAAFAAEEF